jgi:hypothetical protein
MDKVKPKLESGLDRRDKVDLKLESLKMIRERSTWLAGLQAGICALLWTPLRESLDKTVPKPMATDLIVYLHLGWFAFLLSLLLTALLLGRLPRMIETLAQNEKESIFQEYAVAKISLGTMLWAIYALFFLGLVLTGVFVLLRVNR